jgi:metal-dependent hydrolase (beta-lactamase superfamily II)
MRACRTDQHDEGRHGGVRGRQIARGPRGFHLGPAPQDYVDHTVTELERLLPDVIVPMHCSGAKFVAAMHLRMLDRLVTANIGSRFTFGV